MAVQLYGHPVSQPTRAVIWLCLMNNVKIDLKKIDPFAGDNQTEEFLKMNPTGLIPTLKEEENDDFVLFESPAIMIYLAEKYNWTKWYPTDRQIRAKIHQYMSWHHQNTRKSSWIFRNVMMLHFGMGGEKQQKIVDGRQEFLSKTMSMLNHWLNGSGYLVTNGHPSLADILCYCELDQLKAMNLFDFTSLPNLDQWMRKMEALPQHFESHKSMNRLIAQIQQSSTAKL